MFDRFTKQCGAAPFKYDVKPVRKIGLNYIFKFGKYKGMSLIEVLMVDKEYIKNILENGEIEFTKKDDKKIRNLLYDSKDKETT